MKAYRMLLMLVTFAVTDRLQCEINKAGTVLAACLLTWPSIHPSSHAALAALINT